MMPSRSENHLYKKHTPTAGHNCFMEPILSRWKGTIIPLFLKKKYFYAWAPNPVACKFQRISPTQKAHELCAVLGYILAFYREVAVIKKYTAQTAHAHHNTEFMISCCVGKAVPAHNSGHFSIQQRTLPRHIHGGEGRIFTWSGRIIKWWAALLKWGRIFLIMSSASKTHFSDKKSHPSVY